MRLTTIISAMIGAGILAGIASLAWPESVPWSGITIGAVTGVLLARWNKPA